jgi:RNA polymerase sigma-70 factor, ECF subfamily
MSASVRIHHASASKAAARDANSQKSKPVLQRPGNRPTTRPPGGKDSSADDPADEGKDERGDSIDWPDLVSRVKSGETSGMEDLYQLFTRGIRFYLCRQLGIQELDDKVHDTFLIVVHAIRRGDLREPDRLMGFVRTIVRRQVAAHIDQVVHSRREELHLDVGVRVVDSGRNPEQNMAFQQKVDFMDEILAMLAERDAEILRRFYLYEESQEEICQEMDLSETQFRLLKSRAKQRFGELGKKKLQQKLLMPFFTRISAG